MRDYIRFLRLWVSKAFTRSFGATETLSGLFAAALSAYSEYDQKGNITMKDWEILLWACAAVVMVRLFIAPYLIWKEQKDRADTLQTRNGQAIVSQSYGQYVSRIYADLIDDWRKGGIEVGPHPLGFFTVPESLKYWHRLEELSIDLNQPDSLRVDLKKFLSYFIVQEMGLLGAWSAKCYIHTTFDTENELEAQRPTIKALAQSLAERLKNVRRQESET